MRATASSAVSLESVASSTTDACNSVFSAPGSVQRDRVLARPGMTPERFDALLARQVPDAEKRGRSDFLIDSGQGLEAARTQVRRILAAVNDPQWKRPARLAEPSEPPQ